MHKTSRGPLLWGNHFHCAAGTPLSQAKAKHEESGGTMTVNQPPRDETDAAQELEQLGNQVQSLCDDAAENTDNPQDSTRRRLRLTCRRLGAVLRELDG